MNFSDKECTTRCTSLSGCWSTSLWWSCCRTVVLWSGKVDLMDWKARVSCVDGKKCIKSDDENNGLMIYDKTDSQLRRCSWGRKTGDGNEWKMKLAMRHSHSGDFSMQTRRQRLFTWTCRVVRAVESETARRPKPSVDILTKSGFGMSAKLTSSSAVCTFRYIPLNRLELIKDNSGQSA